MEHMIFPDDDRKQEIVNIVIGALEECDIEKSDPCLDVIDQLCDLGLNIWLNYSREIIIHLIKGFKKFHTCKSKQKELELLENNPKYMLSENYDVLFNKLNNAISTFHDDILKVKNYVDLDN